jgi:hypothetical protein
VHPGKDDKILTDWNGLMIAAFARGAQVFDEPKYAEAAERAVDFIFKNMRAPTIVSCTVIVKIKLPSKRMLMITLFSSGACLNCMKLRSMSTTCKRLSTSIKICSNILGRRSRRLLFYARRWRSLARAQ